MVPNNTIVVAGIGSLPDDWRLFVANDVSIKITKGTTPPKSEISNSGKIPFLRVNNLSFNGCLKKDSDFIFVSEESHVNFLSRSRAYPDDILMNIVGPPLGKITRLDNAYSEYNLNQAIVFYRLNTDMVDAGFFTSYLGSSRAQDWLQSRSKKTSGQQNLTIEICKQLPVPVPLLSEQKKIAEILSTWDQAISTAEQLLDNSQRQKKALMQQLLTGKKRLLDNNGVRFSGDWKKHNFSDLVSLGKEKFDPKTSDFISECVELEHISQATAQLDGSTNTINSVSTKNVFEPNDILFGKLRPYLRKYWLADRKGVCSTEIWVFKAKKQLIAQYLFQLVQLDSFIDAANKSSGTHMPRADWNIIKDFMVPVPTMDEQKKIADVLSSADQGIATLQRKLDCLKQEKKALMQQLLTGKRRVLVN